MRHAISGIAAALVLLVSCSESVQEPYGSLCNLSVRTVYPAGYSSVEGVDVRISNMNTGDVYLIPTKEDGSISCSLPKGVYDVAVSEVRDELIFSGISSRLQLLSDMSVEISLSKAKAGRIVIKEIYCGGCSKAPLEGNYYLDKYIVLHNNHFETQYLDSLCFGCLSPYNSTASNPWTPEEQDFIPVIECIWQIGGNGHSFSLEPGEDAVIAINGAIDHSSQYPLSVNLNRPDYFVCYNETFFTNVSYHPAPGDQIRPERHLDVVIKTGQSNAYPFSQTSPAAVIFKAAGQSIQDFVAREGSLIEVPGSSGTKVVAIPLDWTIDAVDVFAGTSASNKKRFPASLDAGAVSLSATGLGHSLLRQIDDDLSKAMGFEVLADTNNSTVDFVESEKQSLHE